MLIIILNEEIKGKELEIVFLSIVFKAADLIIGVECCVFVSNERYEDKDDEDEEEDGVTEQGDDVDDVSVDCVSEGELVNEQGDCVADDGIVGERTEGELLRC
ncbi:MAG: hypothetical protein EZS28_008227 [Streblomastix strix]|uniref:Uncharacterized protein n=1 Tax=Streblomastix strix TaxID=222440 RepID=A0A5J4WME3_9EUKA|nr:MAG: hypothetical protein EZS28_008227 [Streblomastix strix]